MAASNPDLEHFQKTLVSWARTHAAVGEAGLVLLCREAGVFRLRVVGQDLLDTELGPSEELSRLLSHSSLLTLDQLPDEAQTAIRGLSVRPVPATASLLPLRSKTGLLGALLLFHQSLQRWREEAVSVGKYTRLISALLAIVSNVEEQRKLAQQSEVFLAMAQNVFSSLDNMSSLVRNIAGEAKSLIGAETCSLFLLDKDSGELVAEVFEDGLVDPGPDPRPDRDPEHPEDLREIRLPITQGIAGRVAQTGTLMNIPDAYAHPSFFTGVDQKTGFHTRNILCFPIKNQSGEVVGVAELCNKVGRPAFSSHDEQIASTFAVYCAISISHCLLYRKLRESHRRTHLASELAQSSPFDVPEAKVLQLKASHIQPTETIHPNFSSFRFLPRQIGAASGGTIPQHQAILSMFSELGLLGRYRIPRERLARFLLMVEAGYRSVPYHNWSHAFSVSHFAFCLMRCESVRAALSPLQQLAFFVAALCHDIDHRGTNNAFQVELRTPLAQLYSSEGSVLERHHFAQTVCILNQDDANFFDALSPKEYNQMLDLIREIILASDLSQHLGKVQAIQAMIQEGFDASDAGHSQLLLGLLMTASDLSDQSKPFSQSKTIAASIYSEFFSQGDLEKALGKAPSSAMVDREKARVPRLQLDFLDFIALPVYEMLSQLVGETASVYDGIRDGRRCWEALDELVESGEVSALPGQTHILKDPDVEAKVLRAVAQRSDPAHSPPSPQSPQPPPPQDLTDAPLHKDSRDS